MNNLERGFFLTQIRYLSFKPENSNIPVKIWVNWDFESLNTSVEDFLEKWKTRKVCHEKLVAPGYHIFSDLPIVLNPKCLEYFGDNNVKWFVE